MAYVVYHSYPRRRSLIHREDCRFYLNRLLPDDQATGRWEGPFETFESAEESAPGFQRSVTPCKQCMISHTTGGTEVPLTVRGINEELWLWLRTRSVLEGRTVGEVLNELIEDYRREVGSF